MPVNGDMWCKVQCRCTISATSQTIDCGDRESRGSDDVAIPFKLNSKPMDCNGYRSHANYANEGVQVAAAPISQMVQISIVLPQGDDDKQTSRKLNS